MKSFWPTTDVACGDRYWASAGHCAMGGKMRMRCAAVQLLHVSLSAEKRMTRRFPESATHRFPLGSKARFVPTRIELEVLRTRPLALTWPVELGFLPLRLGWPSHKSGVTWPCWLNGFG